MLNNRYYYSILLKIYLHTKQLNVAEKNILFHYQDAYRILKVVCQYFALCLLQLWLPVKIVLLLVTFTKNFK